MIKLYSPKRAERIIISLDDKITLICRTLHLPAAALKAVLYKEITEIDLLDPLADTVVALNLQRTQLLQTLPESLNSCLKPSVLQKFDSSTGYGQIFACTAILAIRFAAERGILSTSALGLGEHRVLSPDSPSDRAEIWRKLHYDHTINLICTALNLLYAAWEMTGKTDFENLTPEETKLVFTRYNADVRHITLYGEIAYRYYMHYLGNQGSFAENE